jgi:hypothetical protein
MDATSTLILSVVTVEQRKETMTEKSTSMCHMGVFASTLIKELVGTAINTTLDAKQVDNQRTVW